MYDEITSPELTPDIQFILVVWFIIFGISLFIYRKWRKKYKEMPYKTTEGKLIKAKDRDAYYGYTESSHAPYTETKYEFYIDGKRHTATFKFYASPPHYLPPETVTLHYRKGAKDVQLEKKEVFSLPVRTSFYIFLYFSFGIGLITGLIYKFVFLG